MKKPTNTIAEESNGNRVGTECGAAATVLPVGVVGCEQREDGKNRAVGQADLRRSPSTGTYRASLSLFAF